MNRLTFEQIAALQDGDVFYECEFNINIEARVSSNVVVAVNEDNEREIHFFAEVMYGNPKQKYMINEKYMHYAPRLYSAPAYAGGVTPPR